MSCLLTKILFLPFLSPVAILPATEMESSRSKEQKKLDSEKE